MQSLINKQKCFELSMMFNWKPMEREQYILAKYVLFSLFLSAI